jgi:hypothetical protein
LGTTIDSAPLGAEAIGAWTGAGATGTGGGIASFDFIAMLSVNVITIDGDAESVAARLDSLPAAVAGIAPTATDDSDTSGIWTLAPHSGHSARLPASDVLTLSLCPLGHEKRIPISSPDIQIRQRDRPLAFIIGERSTAEKRTPRTTRTDNPVDPSHAHLSRVLATRGGRL